MQGPCALLMCCTPHVQDEEVTIPERHLGLHMPEDGSVPNDYLARLARLIEAHVDLDGVMEVAAQARVPACASSAPPAPQPPPPGTPRVRIGVARDAAFCFYYHEWVCLPVGLRPQHACWLEHPTALLCKLHIESCKALQLGPAAGQHSATLCPPISMTPDHETWRHMHSNTQLGEMCTADTKAKLTLILQNQPLEAHNMVILALEEALSCRAQMRHIPPAFPYAGRCSMRGLQEPAAAGGSWGGPGALLAHRGRAAGPPGRRVPGWGLPRAPLPPAVNQQRHASCAASVRGCRGCDLWRVWGPAVPHPEPAAPERPAQLHG